MSETVIITKEHFNELAQTQIFMGCLGANGVDSWEGYKKTVEDYEKIKKNTTQRETKNG